MCESNDWLLIVNAWIFPIALIIIMFFRFNFCCEENCRFHSFVSRFVQLFVLVSTDLTFCHPMLFLLNDEFVHFFTILGSIYVTHYSYNMYIGYRKMKTIPKLSKNDSFKILLTTREMKLQWHNKPFSFRLLLLVVLSCTI